MICNLGRPNTFAQRLLLNCDFDMEGVIQGFTYIAVDRALFAIHGEDLIYPP